MSYQISYAVEVVEVLSTKLSTSSKIKRSLSSAFRDKMIKTSIEKSKL
jgi:hypothetical protein